MLFWVPCAIPSHTQGLTRWVGQSLTFFFPCALQLLYKIGGDTDDGRIEGCWSARSKCLEEVFWARTQTHGKIWRGIASKSRNGWDALCAILDDRGFMPGPLADSCLKHCRSRQKVTPWRFVCISYFPRKKWSSNVLAKLREQEIWWNFKFNHGSIFYFSIIKSAALPKAFGFVVYDALQTYTGILCQDIPPLDFEAMS